MRVEVVQKQEERLIIVLLEPRQGSIGYVGRNLVGKGDVFVEATV